MKIPVRMQQNEVLTINLYNRVTFADFPLGWVYLVGLSGAATIELTDGKPQLQFNTLNANSVLAIVPYSIPTDKKDQEKPVVLTLRTAANTGFQGEVCLELGVGGLNRDVKKDGASSIPK